MLHLYQSVTQEQENKRHTMAELRWIIMFFFLMLIFTAAEQRSHFVVRDGDEVSLPVECFRNQMEACNKTTWIFTGQRNTITLFEFGKIHNDARTKSDRLSVTSDCSLVIKKISVEDVGLYVCRQFKSSGQKVAESEADLSVVNMTEQKISDETILICSVSSYAGCPQSVKWLYDNKDDENIKTITPPQSACSATVSFTTSPHVSTSKRSELFRCQVKYGGDMKEFSFRISPQREKPDFRTIITAAVGSVLLVVTVAATIAWRKTKGNKTWMNKNTEQELVPAGSQAAGGSSHNLEDPAGGVAYASISYTKKTSSNTRVIDGEDDDGPVTYSTVKPPSSDDPSKLYAAVNKPKH